MPDRRRQIVLLIGSRYDYRYEPPTFSGNVRRRGALDGELATDTRVCEACNGEGGRYDRYRQWQVCGQCHGRLVVKVDAYTGKPGEHRPTDSQGTPFGMSWSEHFTQLLERDTRRVKCPDCQNLAGDATGLVRGERCRRCDGTGEAAVAGSWLSEPERQQRSGDAVLEAIVRRDQAGSYRELDAALAMLPATAVRLLDALYVNRATALDSLTVGERTIHELALGLIDRRMPDPIRVPVDVVANERMRDHHRKTVKGRSADPKALEQRNQQARRWAKEGRPLTWIRSQFDLSDRQLREVLNGKSRG